MYMYIYIVYVYIYMYGGSSWDTRCRMHASDQLRSTDFRSAPDTIQEAFVGYLES